MRTLDRAAVFAAVARWVGDVERVDLFCRRGDVVGAAATKKTGRWLRWLLGGPRVVFLCRHELENAIRRWTGEPKHAELRWFVDDVGRLERVEIRREKAP